MDVSLFSRQEMRPKCGEFDTFTNIFGRIIGREVSENKA